MRKELEERYGEDHFRYVASAIGDHPFARAQRQNAGIVQGRGGSANLGEVTVELLPAEQRSVSSVVIADRWRELTGQVPDALELAFTSSLFSAGAEIDIQFTGQDTGDLRAAAEELKLRLGEYAGVFDISDSFLPGKEEVKLAI